MTTTINLWAFFGVALLCCLIGFAFGILAAWPPENPRPRQVPPSPQAGSPLPRPGYLEVRLDDPYPTVPALIWSPHAAQLEATEREIEQMTASARKYLPPPWPALLAPTGQGGTTRAGATPPPQPPTPGPAAPM